MPSRKCPYWDKYFEILDHGYNQNYGYNGWGVRCPPDGMPMTPFQPPTAPATGGMGPGMPPSMPQIIPPSFQFCPPLTLHCDPCMPNCIPNCIPNICVPCPPCPPVSPAAGTQPCEPDTWCFPDYASGIPPYIFGGWCGPI